MKYLLAILLPPIAVLLCGRPFMAILNLLLTLCFWIPGIIHAMIMVHGYNQDKRTDRIVNAINQNS